MDEYQEANAPDQSIRKKLNSMFNRYNYVGITNPLKEDFSWPVALEQNEIVNVLPGDPMNEELMAKKSGGTFLPGDSTTRAQQKIVKVNIAASQKRMISGEAAFVVVPRLFSALVREKYGASKSGLAKLRNPSIQDELIKQIVTGPLINNVADAMQTYADERMKQIEGFSDVQVNPPKGFSDPVVLAKAQATRNANKAAQANAA